MTTDPHPPHHPASAETPAHWGRLESHLLFDPERYGAYAAAHHLAGHHWTRHRLQMTRRSAGLRLDITDATFPPLERERAAVVEATAVLVEALAIEAAVCADADLDFGLDVEIDWTTVSEHVGATHHDARRRGCTADRGRTAALLEHENWIRGTGHKILRDWVGIAALANALGLGRVLEADQVARILRCGACGE